MAQDGTTAGGSSYTIDNVTFPVGRSKLQSIFDAIRSTNIGNTAPDLVAGQFWIDNNTPSTTVWTLYLYDGTDNISFATIDTVNNTVNFLDSTFDLINDTTPQLGGNLASNGNDIIFADSDKAIFGAGSDLEIFHNGSNSFVKDVGSGALILDTNGTDVRITKSDAEFMAKFVTDGAVELYHDNSKKFETTSTGATVTTTLSGASDLNLQTSDANEKITLDMSGTQRFNVNGSERMRLNSTGLGIGTSSPSTKLHVDDSGGANVLISRTTTGEGIYLESDGTNGNVRTTSSTGSLRLQTNGNNTRLSINSSGNVGIGTISPDSILDLTSTPNNNFIHFNATTGGLNGDIIGGFEVNNTGGTIGKLTVNRETTNSSGYMAFQTGTTEKMRINNSGNVGIGTASPSYPLEIASSSQDILYLNSSHATNCKIKLQGGYHSNLFSTITESAGVLILDVDTNNQEANSNFRVKVKGTERMRIDSSGNVGIGTTTMNSILNLYSSSNTQLQFQDASTGTSTSSGSRIGYNGSGAQFWNFENNYTRFATNNAERMRISSDGFLFLGQTSRLYNSNGVSLNPSGYSHFTATNGYPLLINRKSSDGEIVNLYRDTTQVGRIGANSSSLYIAGTSKGFRFTASQLKPCNTSGANDDGNYDLGSSSTRFKDLYLGGGLYVGGTGTANKLDDYEEGEYNITATDSGGGATIGLKSYTNRLRYTKIGTTVHVQGRVQASTVTGSYSGTLNINLPFASADLIDTGDSVGTVLGVYADYDSGASPSCWVTEGSSLLQFRTSRYSNQVGNLTIGANDYVVFQITYVTN